MQSIIQTGSSLRLAVAFEKDGNERTIGYATSFSVSQSLGGQPIFGVDSIFPQEIALAGSPSSIQGSMTIYMLKGTDPIRMGLVAPVVDPNSSKNNFPQQAPSRYIHFRLYDRATNELVISAEFCKVLGWSFATQARSSVIVNLSFAGMWLAYGD